MTITYTVKDGLYVNMTNRCPNRCEFCIRNNGAGAYGSDSLWLDREPTREEILADIEKKNPDNFDELVFCGYGEPCCRLDDMLWICAAVRRNHPKTLIRLNTNGLSDLINKKETAPLFKGLFDVISVSLNAPNAKEYDDICHSDFGLDAYPALLAFARDVKAFVPTVLLSVVRGTMSDADIDKCAKEAKEMGVLLRVREYIK